MKQMFQAEDGKLFDTAAACQEYEGRNKLLHFVSKHINATYNDDAGFSIIEESDVVNFINAYIDELIKIVKGSVNSGWIPNVGRCEASFPDSLKADTLVEVQLRDGQLQAGLADDWTLGWRSADDAYYDIIAYRIIT